MNFSQTLIQWYELNKRSLPWRETKDPYKIWLSEVILQQTRVQQGLQYYEHFSETFPTVIDFANASADLVMKMWQGLGYYSRARNMHETAQRIKNEWNGVFPTNFKDLLLLKGVGSYTAAAIASLAFEEDVAVVDGNVYRVLSRIFGISTPIDCTEGKKEFALLAQSLIVNSKPSQYNQAIMEFGALQCTPQSPNCSICPLSLHCNALKNNTIQTLPVKIKKIKQETRYFYFIVIKNKDGVYLRKRIAKDIWNNLYEFPMLESEVALDLFTILSSSKFRTLFEVTDLKIDYCSDLKKHLLTHQIIYHQFIEIYWNESIIASGLEKDFTLVNLSELNNYAVPKPIEQYIKARILDNNN